MQWLLAAASGTYILELDTGLGKTAVAAAISSRRKTIGIVMKRQLQDQYVDYGFTKLVGRGNYLCAHPERLLDDQTASDCLFNYMAKCPRAGECPYLQQRARAQQAQAAVLNYAYYVRAGRSPGWQASCVVLDEAHGLSEFVLDHHTVDINAQVRQQYQLSDFPTIRNRMPPKVQIQRTLPWLEDSRAILSRQEARLQRALPNTPVSTQRRTLGRLRRIKQLQERLSTITKALQEMPDDWYFHADSNQFMVKPLTARHAFPRLFLHNADAVVVCMSATIGSTLDFAKELGVQNPQARCVPSQWEPEQRPVYVYKGVPRMSASSSAKYGLAIFDKQADVMAQAILEQPHDWSGIIHVTRRKEAALLAHRLAHRGLADRIWPMPGAETYIPTDAQMTAWHQRRAQVPNSLCVAWNMHAGYDGRDERIVCVAKVPYPRWGSPGSYEEAWRQYSMDRYRWTAATKLVQALGRTRRGEPDDYDSDGVRRGFVAVFDGSFDGRIKGKMSERALEAVRVV